MRGLQSVIGGSRLAIDRKIYQSRKIISSALWRYLQIIERSGCFLTSLQVL